MTDNLVEYLGADRVIDMPILEPVGGAVTGMRSKCEFQLSDFVTLMMEQTVNHEAKMRFMLGGEVSLPIAVCLPASSGMRTVPQNS